MWIKRVSKEISSRALCVRQRDEVGETGGSEGFNRRVFHALHKKDEACVGENMPYVDTPFVQSKPQFPPIDFYCWQQFCRSCSLRASVKLIFLCFLFVCLLLLLLFVVIFFFGGGREREREVDPADIILSAPTRKQHVSFGVVYVCVVSPIDLQGKPFSFWLHVRISTS